MHKYFKSFELFIRNIDKGDIEVLENYELIDSCVEEILNSSENALIMFLDDYRNRLNSSITDEVFSMIDLTIILHPKLQDEYEKKYIIKSIFLNTTNSFHLLEVYRKNELLSDKFNELYKEMESKHTDIEENNKKMTGQFVSILGIFSAVVLAFNGGFSMITQAMDSLNSASIYRITFLITLIGSVLFNTIMVLLVAISKFNTYKISSYCGKAESDVCFEGKCDKKEKTHSIKTYHCKLKRRYSYAYYINLTFLIIMYFTIGFKMLSDNIITNKLHYCIVGILRSFLNDNSINFICNFILLLVPIFIILIYNYFKNRNSKTKKHIYSNH